MVKPYLWRLGPTGPGPGLRPRPRSRFEPAPKLPIDGPSVESRGVSWLPTSEAESEGVEIETERDAPYPHSADSVVETPRLGVHGPASAQTAAHEPEPRDAQRLPPYSAKAAEPQQHRPAPTTSFVGDKRGSAPERDEEASVRSTTGEGAVRRPPAPPPPSAASHPAPSRTGLPNPAPDSGEFASPRAAPAPAQQVLVQAPPPASRQVLPSAPQQIPPPEPELGSIPAPHRRADRPSPQEPAAQLLARAPAQPEPRADSKPQHEDEVPADRVEAMARWLRHADADSARPEATKMASTGPALAPPPPPASQPAVHTNVSVTIGRIEVKAPAADPVPAQPRSSGPRRQPPSLAEYLEVRTRARGRAR
jgi:hypothetical protein